MEEAFVIRPVGLADLKWFYGIAHMIGTGFTSLPDNRDFIKRRITLVDKSFKEEVAVHERVYLFVREKLPTHEIVGIGGIDVEVGHRESFYNYQISTVTQSCTSLDIFKTHNILNVVNNFQHASEMISFWIHPDWRGHAISRSISLSRFLFIAQFSQWFNSTIISEIRGVSNANGISPFWEAVGRHFFGMDFNEADALTMTQGKQYIADLVSRDPIYIDLLPLEAQRVIGQEHQESKTARQGLESLGFKFNNHVDIFDAGPLLSAERDSIKPIRENVSATIAKLEKVEKGVSALVYNNQLNARMTITDINILNAEEIIIAPEIAKILLVKPGASIRYYVM